MKKLMMLSISILCLCIPIGVSAQPVFSGEWGSTGSGNGEFSRPIGIEVNQTNERVYVVDNANDRIQVFTWQGDFLFSFGEVISVNQISRWRQLLFPFLWVNRFDSGCASPSRLGFGF